MVGRMMTLRVLFLSLALGVALCSMAVPVHAQSTNTAEAASAENAAANTPVDIGRGIKIAGLAIGAGLAIAGGAIGTGRVQAAVSASGIGVLAEKREMLSLIFILLAFPETLVVLGFVLAIMLINLM